MNKQDDPFFSADDRTVIRPVPGGRHQDIKRPAETNFSVNTSTMSIANLGKVNPLESAASALLALISQLYHSQSHSEPQKLTQQLTQEIKTFRISAEKAGYDAETLADASYGLCTTIDEAIFNTPWGRQSGWGERSLLSVFHGEVSGGEQFFFKLKKLGQDPSKHLHLLELMYICLALGFQGRYRIADRGQEKLTQIRDWLMQLIHKQRGSSERLLSPHWQGIVTKKKNVINTIPLWVFVALASVLLLAVFMGFLFALNASVSPLKKEISSLSIPQVKVAPKPDELATLRQLFKQDIAAQSIDIREKNGRSLIELRGVKGLFASGSDQVIKRRIKLIEKISDVLVSKQFVHHKLNIVGHTDNIAIKNPIRFADNDALSKARADSIAKLLVTKNSSIADRQRILSEGKADYEPIDTANTKEARQKNRRVEIILQ